MYTFSGYFLLVEQLLKIRKATSFNIFRRIRYKHENCARKGVHALSSIFRLLFAGVYTHGMIWDGFSKDASFSKLADVTFTTLRPERVLWGDSGEQLVIRLFVWGDVFLTISRF